MRLAELIGMTRDELLRRMSSSELIDWIAEFNIRKYEAEQRRQKLEQMKRVKARRR